jgi:hypothetical protein
MPAWLIRGGKREPLAIGAQLRNGDQINTGTGSRALLRMRDGGTVKLGENARFSLDGMAQKADGGTSLFTASMLSETDGTTMAIRLKAELGLEHVAVSLQ